MEEPQPQPQKSNKEDVIREQNKLLAVIPAQFSNLTNYYNQIKGLDNNPTEKFLIMDEYRHAGYNYKSLIILGLKFLLSNHSPKDTNEIIEIYKNMDFEPFKELDIASFWGDKIVFLTNNALNYVDDLSEEIEAQTIINSI